MLTRYQVHHLLSVWTWIAMLSVACAAAAQPMSEAAAPAEGYSLYQEGVIALRLTAQQTLRPSTGFDLYTTDATILGRGAGAAVDVWRPTRHLALAAEADWLFEKASSAGLFGGDYASWYTHHQIALGASLRYRALGFVTPHVRAFGLLALTKQRLKAPAPGQNYRTSFEPTGGAGLALGATLRTPSIVPTKRPSVWLSLGLRFEVGYILLASPAFDLEAGSESEYAIPIRGASLGSLSLSAAFFRASLELRL